MAVLASVFGVLGRFAGKFLTTTLGWASALLFGRIPEDRQVRFAILTFGSIVWVATVVGILVPSLGTFLVALVPLPDWVDETMVRIAMLVAALVLPALLGVVTLFIADPADRPTGGSRIGAILRGYPLTPVLAGTLVLLAGAGIVRKAKALLARRATAHVAIVVRPGRYEALVGRVEGILRDAELDVERRDGSRILTGPARLLASISGTGIRSLVPDRLAVLAGPEVELEVYPSDLAISGRAQALARARAAIVRDLRSEDCWLTTRRDAQEIEDRLAALHDPPRPVDAPALAEIDRRLATESIDDEEWDVLYRRRLQVVADATGTNLDAAATGTDPGGRDAEPGRRLGEGLGGNRPRLSLGTILGAATAGLVLVDILLLAIRHPRSRR